MTAYLDIGTIWLRVREGVKTSLFIRDYIHRLEKYFEADKVMAEVTSGYREPTDQLQLIIDKSRDYGISTVGFDKNDVLTKNGLYVWQIAWSQLLEKGFIINPPIDAVCLYDYVSPFTGELMRGKVIPASPHSRGTAFDIAGVSAARVLDAAIAAGEMIKYRVERVNNATHVDIIAPHIGVA